MSEKIVTMKSLGKIFKVDKSVISVYIKKHNLRNKLIGVRSSETGNRLTKALKEIDAVYLWKLRQEEGFSVEPLFFDDGYKIVYN